MSEEKLEFQAEVSRLLHLMVNAVYSDKEVFLRELISNASDACDKLRYRAITEPELIADEPEFRVVIAADKEARTLTIADNGIGMNRDDLVRDLGTIARSGTSAFVDNLTGDAKKDMQLIGQFGVGFYSVFRWSGFSQSSASCFRCSVMLVPRASRLSSVTVKLPWPSECQRQASASPALRLTTSTLSATMKTE